METSRAVVHTLMPRTSKVISMNFRDFSSLIARTMSQLLEDECCIPIRPRGIPRWRRIDVNPINKSTTYEIR